MTNAIIQITLEQGQLCPRRYLNTFIITIIIIIAIIIKINNNTKRLYIHPIDVDIKLYQTFGVHVFCNAASTMRPWTAFDPIVYPFVPPSQSLRQVRKR